MSVTQSAPSKKKLIIIGLIVVVAAALFIAKITIEKTAAERAREDLTLYEPLLVLESADVSASLLSRSIVYTNIAYTMPDAPEITLKIGKMTQKGIDLSTLLGNPGDITSVGSMTMENMSMLVSSLEQPLFEWEHYQVSDFAYPYRDVREVLLKNKGSKDIFKSFSELSSYIGNSRSGPDMGRNMKINLGQLGAFDFELGSFASSGQTELDAAATGFDMGVSSIRLNDFLLTFEDSWTDMPYMVKLGEFTMRGLKYNYKAMLEAFAEYGERKDPITLLVGIIPSFYNYEFDKVEAKNLVATYDSAMFTLESFELGPRTLKEQGPNIVRNIALKYGPVEAFTLKEIGLDKFILSDRLVEVIKNPGKAINEPAFLNEISSAPYNFLKGIRLENLYIADLKAKSFISVDNWRSDIEFGERINLKSVLRDLYISQDALLQVLALTSYNYELQEVLGMLSRLRDGVTLNSEFGLSLLVAKALDYTASFSLKEASLGDFRMSLEGFTDRAASYQTYGEPMLRKMELFFEDAGIRDVIFEYLVASYYDTFEDMNDDLDDLFAELISESSGVMAEAIKTFQVFMMEGGGIEMILNPVTPVPFEDIDYLFEDSPELLGVKIEHVKPSPSVMQ